jgi:hypothetical protein
MKSINEILIMLVGELSKHFDKIKSIKTRLIHYNEILGDTSFIIAGLLESLLKTYYSDWDNKKWIDDSLIKNVIIQKDKLIILGIMIWGRENTTQQWTDPFYFEIELIEYKSSYKNFIFLFGDLNTGDLSYEEFKSNPSYWDVRDKNWMYIIHSDIILGSQ